MIGQKYPDVKVVYTRKTDVLIPLNERGNIANKAGADLFISIHINSNKSSAPSGTSTYVMGVDKAGKNLDVAMKENDVISYEDDYSTKYQGYVPGSPESFIIFSLIQSAYLSQKPARSRIWCRNSLPVRPKCRTAACTRPVFGAVVGGDAEHPGGVRVYFESRGGEVRRF